MSTQHNTSHPAPDVGRSARRPRREDPRAEPRFEAGTTEIPDLPQGPVLERSPQMGEGEYRSRS